MKIKKLLRNPYILATIVLFLIGFFLRMYKIDSFITFLGDQGRDAIVMKRIITLEHFPGIGASSSVGNVFLGPFYYYFAAPWLLLTNFSPLGPAIGVAVFGSLMIPASYFMAKDLFNERVGLLMAAFTAFSVVFVDLSRFSWNPNLLPFSALLTFYFFVKGFQKNCWRDYGLAGVFIGISMQFHYVSLAFGLPMLLVFAWDFYQKRKKLLQPIRNLGAMIVGVAIVLAPLIIFDLRNNFINTRAFMQIFTTAESVSSVRGFGEILYTFTQFSGYALQFEISDIVGTILLGSMIAGMWFARKQKEPLSLLLGFFLVMLVITSYFTQKKIIHYFGALYPLYYLILAYALNIFWEKKSLKWVVVMFMGLFVFLNARNYDFVNSGGARQIDRSIRIARSIEERITVDTYQVASLPDKFGDTTYRYFLEVWGNRPLEKDTREQADELFVVCVGECTPIGDPLWDIAFFQPTEVVDTWDIEDVTIYKLIRE